jgi:predicted DsbA family dithiol-disulfide isomerase
MGKQLALKEALMTAYFTQLKDLSDPKVLASAAEEVGLDPLEALEVIGSQRYADQVREEEASWRDRGVNSVPTVIVNDRYVIVGGNPPEEFERQLRAIVAE